MTRTLENPQQEDLAGGGGKFLDAEGVFHFRVVDIKDGQLPASYKSDKSIAGFSVEMEVVHGEHNGCLIGLPLYDANMSHKDGGKSSRAKQLAFLVATNVLTLDQVNGQTLSYDEQDADGQQFIAELSFGKENDKGKRYLEWHYSNIYHVDDPRAAKVAKSETALKLIPAKYRHDAKYFESIQTSPKAAEKSANNDPDFEGL